jgi:transcriptional regulator with XRE-family HTH domain
MCNNNTEYGIILTDCVQQSWALLIQLCFMVIHIGNKIKQVFTKKGMTVSEFGRRINKSRENVYSIFKRKTIDTGLLQKISDVLEYDFFQYYTPLKDEVVKLKKENALLKEIWSKKK